MKKLAECLVFWGILLVVFPADASGQISGEDIVWDEPELIQEIINFGNAYRCSGIGKMTVTDDQTKMVIGLNNCKGYGPNRDFDLWMFFRATKDDLWDTGTNLNDICIPGPGGEVINTYKPDYSPTMNGDGTILVWESKRPGQTTHKRRLWQSDWDNIQGKWGPPRELVEIDDPPNSKAEDGDGGISSNGLELFFASNRANTNTQQKDIWVTRRNSTADSWGTPEKLDDPINTDDFDEQDVSISPDGRHIFFASDRRGDLDLYWYTREWDDKSNNWGPWGPPFDNCQDCIHPPPPINKAGKNDVGFDLAGNALYFVRAKAGSAAAHGIPYVSDPFVSARVTITSIGIYGKAERTVIIEGRVSVFQMETFIPDRWYEQKGVPKRFIDLIREED